jgi:hypothetical protein
MSESAQRGLVTPQEASDPCYGGLLARPGARDAVFRGGMLLSGIAESRGCSPCGVFLPCVGGQVSEGRGATEPPRMTVDTLQEIQTEARAIITVMNNGDRAMGSWIEAAQHPRHPPAHILYHARADQCQVRKLLRV